MLTKEFLESQVRMMEHFLKSQKDEYGADELEQHHERVKVLNLALRGLNAACPGAIGRAALAQSASKETDNV